MNIELLSREAIIPEKLLNLNPVLPAYQKITNESVSELYNELYQVSPESVLFKYIPMAHDYNDEDSYISVVEFAQQPLFNNSNDSSDEKISKFLDSLPITSYHAITVKIKTWEQSSNQLWVLTRKGRITASNHHEVFTKVNTTIHRKSSLSQKQPL